MKRTSIFLVVLGWSCFCHGAGTISLWNSVFSRMQLYDQATRTVTSVPDAYPIVYGLFWGFSTNRSEFKLALPLGTSSGLGLINAPSFYTIPGSEAGQTVYVQIHAWPAEYGTNWGPTAWLAGLSDLTPVLKVPLGSASGPGTFIWQGRNGSFR